MENDPLSDTERTPSNDVDDKNPSPKVEMNSSQVSKEKELLVHEEVPNSGQMSPDDKKVTDDSQDASIDMKVKQDLDVGASSKTAEGDNPMAVQVQRGAQHVSPRPGLGSGIDPLSSGQSDMIAEVGRIGNLDESTTATDDRGPPVRGAVAVGRSSNRDNETHDAGGNMVEAFAVDAEPVVYASVSAEKERNPRRNAIVIVGILVIVCVLVVLVVTLAILLTQDRKVSSADDFPSSTDDPAPSAPPTGTKAPTPPPPTEGVAFTGRYWDCTGGACGCGYYSANGSPAHCYSNAMFSAPPDNPFGATFYGTAALSPVLFEGPEFWLGRGCGKCWTLTGTANVPGRDPAVTTIVVKGTNVCTNPAKCLDKITFDIAAPGFHSGWKECDSLETNERPGFAACEDWMFASDDPTENCDCSLFQNPVLKAGCENFFSLGWHLPNVTFRQVTCPIELERLPCWANEDFSSGAIGFCGSQGEDP